MVYQVVGFSNWDEIAKQGLPQRTQNQILDQYIHVIDPINHEKTLWTKENFI